MRNSDFQRPNRNADFLNTNTEQSDNLTESLSTLDALALAEWYSYIALSLVTQMAIVGDQV